MVIVPVTEYYIPCLIIIFQSHEPCVSDGCHVAVDLMKYRINTSLEQQHCHVCFVQSTLELELVYLVNRQLEWSSQELSQERFSFIGLTKPSAIIWCGLGFPISLYITHIRIVCYIVMSYCIHVIFPL